MPATSAGMTRKKGWSMALAAMARCRAGPPPETKAARLLLAQILEELLDPREEALALGVGALLVARLLELAQQFLLPLGEVHRRLDHDLHVHVAARGRAKHGHTLVLEAELVAGLRAGGDADLGAVAVDGRHLDAAAQGRGRHRD